MNNNPLHQPPPPPPLIAPSAAITSSSLSGGNSGGGIARSAPIRTLPTSTSTTTTAASSAVAVGHRGYSRGIVAHPNPHAHSFPSSRGVTQSLQSSPDASSSLVGTRSSVATAAAIGYATTPHVYAPNSGTGSSMYEPQAATARTGTTSHTTDPVVMSRQTSDTPIMMARQSSDFAGGSGNVGMMNTPENSTQLQPHNFINVSLPHSSQPQQHGILLPPSTPPLLLSTTQTAMHPLDHQHHLHQQQQQFQSYPPHTQLLQQAATTSTTANTASSPYYRQPSISTSPSQDPHQLQQHAAPQGIQPIPQSVSPTKEQHQSHPTIIGSTQQFASTTTTTNPLSPEEEVDFFLRGGTSSTAAATITTTTTTKVQQPADASKLLHPLNLSSSKSPLEKCQSLASRRAWRDVLQLTKDVLMRDIRNKAGGDSGRSDGTGGSGTRGHHILYNELLLAASPSSALSSSSGNALIKGQPNVGRSGTNSIGDGVPELEEEEDGWTTLQKETCQFIALRCISLLKLRRYEELKEEVTSLGLLPHLPDRSNTTQSTSSATTSPASFVPNTTDSSPLAWREGSLHSTENSDVVPDWVPFGLRLLAAQQLQFTATTTEEASQAIDVLYDLRDRTVRTEYWNTPKSLEIWRGAIGNALFNSFVWSREWRLALHTCQDMMLGLECGVDSEVESWCNKTTTTSGEFVSEEERQKMKEVITTAAYVELHSRQLFVLLQSGAISAAEMIQKEARQHATKVQFQLHPYLPLASSMPALSRMSKEYALVRQVPIRVRVNEGLLQFARLKYMEAAKHFSDALHQQRQLFLDPIIVSSTLQSNYPSWNDLISPTLGFDAEQSLIVECINNVSLCELYSGSMHLAVEKLEGLIRENPCCYLTDTVAFNLCTLYELGSDGEECTRKKKVLQRVSHRFFLHDIGSESFRLG